MSEERENIKYEFVQESRERAMTARSAHYRRSHNGKGGRMKTPSDSLSRKELLAMNGDVKTYNMNEPMTWNDFKDLPDDLKQIYIHSIREKYGAPDSYIAEMFGINASTVSNHFKCWGLNKGVDPGAAHRKWEKEKFLAWAHGAPSELVYRDNKVGPAPDEPKPVMPIGVRLYTGTMIVPTSGSLSFMNADIGDVAATITDLIKRNKVNVTFSWTIVEDEKGDECCE